MLISCGIERIMENIPQYITMLIDEIFGYFGINTAPLVSEVLTMVMLLIIWLFLGWIIYIIVERYLTRWSKKTKNKLDDEILKNIKLPLYLIIIIIGSYYALTPLSILQPFSAELAITFIIIEILLVTFVITRIINVLFAWYAEKQKEHKKDVSDHLLFILKKIIHAVVYIFAFFIILYAFNIDLSGVVVGLGVGGIAIAFALQNILGDIFSAFTIYFDKPFEIGDFIIIGSDAGTVKKIGIKSTRIQTLQGEELIVSNHELVNTRIRNFKQMRKRRISFTFGVIYGTPQTKLKKIPEMIKNIIDGMDLADMERVHFKEFSSSSLTFEVVYYIKSKDYVKYMDTQQDINLEIKKAFEKEGIEMAFPTQTILLKES